MATPKGDLVAATLAVADNKMLKNITSLHKRLRIPLQVTLPVLKRVLLKEKLCVH